MPTVQLPDVTLNTVDRGAGRPLLLVHGFPLDHTMWQKQIDALSEDARVIAPDLRGFGSSGVTPGTVTMEQFADDLAALLDALQVTEPVCFCGLSMGGYIGWQFFRRHRSRMRSLVLCDTRAAADSPEAAQNRHTLAEKVLRRGPEAVAEGMIPKLFSEGTRQQHPELVEATRAVVLRTPPEGIAAALRGMAARPDSTELLGQIDLPTLVVVGQHDSISPAEEMRAMAAGIRGAQFVEVPEAGHMAPLENAEIVNDVLRRFLATA